MEKKALLAQKTVFFSSATRTAGGKRSWAKSLKNWLVRLREPASYPKLASAEADFVKDFTKPQPENHAGRQWSLPVDSSALAGAELTRLLTGTRFGRVRAIHLVIVEQTLRSSTCGGLRQVPIDVLSHAIPQLEELLIDQDSPILHQLLAEMIRMTKRPANSSAPPECTDPADFRTTLPVLGAFKALVEHPIWPHLAPTNVRRPSEEHEAVDGQDGFPSTVAESAVHRPVNHAINRPSGLLW